MLKIDKSSKQTIVKSLDEIAKNLILQKAIVVNQSVYSIIDVECYYYHSNHPDEYAKGVNHNRPIGEFEMHRYGIDLSLGNNQGVDFGGILICGLYDLNKQNVINKSHVVRELFNQLRQGSNIFELIDLPSPWTNVLKSKRLHLGKAEGLKEDYEKELYKFCAFSSEIFKKYPNKEHILRESDLKDDEIFELLKYKLKK